MNFSQSKAINLPLNSCSNRVEHDSVVENFGQLETVSNLLAECKSIAIVEPLYFLKESRRLCDQCTLGKQWFDVFQLMLLGEKRDVRKKLILGHTDKRIADSTVVNKWYGAILMPTYSPSTLAVSLLMLSLRLCSSSNGELRRSWCPVPTLLHIVSTRRQEKQQNIDESLLDLGVFRVRHGRILRVEFYNSPNKVSQRWVKVLFISFTKSMRLDQATAWRQTNSRRKGWISAFVRAFPVLAFDLTLFNGAAITRFKPSSHSDGDTIPGSTSYSLNPRLMSLVARPLRCPTVLLKRRFGSRSSSLSWSSWRAVKGKFTVANLRYAGVCLMRTVEDLHQSEP